MDSTVKQIGRYKVLRELGHGAMGVVYAATDALIGRKVAIKTIRLGALDSANNRSELTQRLHREAQSAGILSHPGIITIHDVGREGEDAYIVMELVEGRTVEELLESGVPQHSKMLLSVLRQAAVALDYAHDKGIIHRDIKPSNLMICENGSVKIADFGVAKLATSTSLTQSGFVLGTPSYMSPEQAQGRTIDGRSDQFSLAVVAYRMITGKLPFEGPTLTALLAKILWEEPAYESAGLSPPVRMVFKRALSKDPQLRFPNCSEFVRNLEESYAQQKAGLLEKIPGIEALAESASVPRMAAKPGAASVPEVSIGATPEIPVQEIAPHPAPSVVLPVQEKPRVADTVETPPPETDAEESPKARARKRSALIAWAASLGILVLMVIAFLVFRVSQKPESPAGQAGRASNALPQASAGSTVVPTEPAKETAATEINPSTKPAPSAKPIAQQGNLTSPKMPLTADSSAIRSKMTAPAKDRAAAVPSKPAPITGVMTWSGKLGRNSILVITAQQSNIGTVTGQLPGRPVEIEVEPPGVVIRQMPAKTNNWNQIMLYSGSEKYNSITIHWRTID
jgi:serine/threonine protein kinase